MTKEDAIRWLEIEKSIIREVPEQPQGARELTEAYDMAIEALSAEAVDVTHDIPEYCSWSQTYTNMVQGAMSKASAEAVQGWIPCSERLPSDIGNYLITVADFRLGHIGEHTVTTADFYAKGKKWNSVVDVVAWMPLPEPYKGGEDE